MNNTIRKEVRFSQSPETVWRSIASAEALADWMYPNDFEPRVGHTFSFRVPPNPAAGFEGLTVRCQVEECDPPRRLAFTWRAGGPVENTRVAFELFPDAEGTRLVLEHSGFDLSQPFGQEAFGGAGYGWSAMLEHLAARLDAPGNKTKETLP